MLKHTFSKSAVTKIQSFLEEVSSRGGHTIYFEDNKEDKKIIRYRIQVARNKSILE